ncbi:MAG: hypothetical protein C5B60_10440 [Chloroflexi bacterium]|nr:MAG: hypothetical protein C5B60_10440 [Chloroflexota bacterium]
MQLSPEEAQAALTSVQQVQDRTRRTVSWGATYEVMWGAIWVIGFLISQFVPVTSESILAWVWGGLWLVGSGLSISLGIYSSRQQPVRRTSGSWFESPQVRFGLFFFALGIYSGVLFALFVPVLLHAQVSPLRYGEQISLWWVVTIMFGYAVIGLWFRLGQLVGVGVAVTASALLAYYLVPDYYYLIMAFLGGGTLMVHGLIWLHPWRS